MSEHRAITVLMGAIVFLGLLAALETCSRTTTATAQIQADARVSIAREHTERSAARLGTVRCVLHHPTCEDRP